MSGGAIHDNSIVFIIAVYSIEVRSLCSLSSVVVVYSVEVRLLCFLPSSICGSSI